MIKIVKKIYKDSLAIFFFLIMSFVLSAVTINVYAFDDGYTVLVRKLKNINTFEADFTQEVSNCKKETINTIKGKLYISKPNQFYWESNSGFEATLISDGKYLWSYDADLEQAIRKPLKKALASSVFNFLLGDAEKLRDNFELVDIEVIDCSEGEYCINKQKVCYMLKPKNSLKSECKHLMLCFTGDTLVSFRVHSLLDQHTELHFNIIKQNKYIPQTRFKFSAPDYVDIITTES